ncbi:hypothetical protein SteCoe_29751 [Stentor coeruleus]|uniref:Uncharacterized protein n=1 Tax=Stentor coeruleus TaxID=5963 RepID=A0A1R2B5J1_9CILI|nr:hypothetical protein SteCoe_29751 [Stentor coeruleus]
MGIPKFYRWLSERYPLIGQPISNIPDIDNLYLDMNGIIHTSAHSNTLGHLIPHLSSSIEMHDMLRKAFSYIEMIFQLVKPKKLFYLALDGVAPRAKMNNQRERRYKFIYEVNEFIAKEKKNGRRTVDDWFDSCNISPGTDYMCSLNEHILCFIKWKIVNDDNWRKVRVIFSGSDVPGEGEHKIMRFIRNNRGEANVRHCIYGLDADLILLGLLSHEPYVVILREEVSIGSFRSLQPRKNVTDPPKFECLFINLLREYLGLEFSCIKGIDLERLIDDFVVLMLFVGNDFIPRLPTFEISEGAVDKLFELYKHFWPQNGYLSQSGVINWGVLRAFIVEFPHYEAEIIKKRIKTKIQRKRETPMAPTSKVLNIKEIMGEFKNQEEEPVEELGEVTESPATRSLKQTLETYFDRGIDHLKKYYYTFVLGLDADLPGKEKIKEMVAKYLEGLQWVMNYYFKGEKDWQWYYPFHYAPLISDFYDCNFEVNEFAVREPYFALEQLLGVIPPGSKNLLPEAYAEIMNDPEFVEYFPNKPTIEYDPMCAKVGWESLKIKVPFVPYDLLIQKARQISGSFKNNIVRTDLAIDYNPREPSHFVQSTIPTLLPDFDCCVKITELNYGNNVFEPFLPEGTNEKLGGFPTLYNVPFTHELKYVGVNKFQGASSRESLVLNFENVPSNFKETYDLLYNKVMYFEYPNCELGLVMGLSNEEEVMPKLTQKDLEYYEMNEIQYIQSIRSSLETCMLYAQGTIVKPTLGIVVHYYPLSAIKRTLKGKLVAEWTNFESFAPLELVMKDRLPGHPRDLTGPSSLQEEFPTGTRVILVKKERLGCLGEVTGYSGNNIQVRVIKKPKNIVSDISKLSSFHDEKYYSVRELSAKVHKPIGLVNKVMGSIKIKVKLPGKTKVLEIGLNLKHDRDYVSVLRWARWGGYWGNSEDWEYSAQALHILQSYTETFPQLWSALENCWVKNKRNFNLEDLFAYSKPPTREVERVALWVCKQPSYKEPWASLYSQYLCETVIENIGKLALSAKNELVNDIENFNPNHIFIPSKPWCPLFTDKILEYKLGNRVVNLNPFYHQFIPFGAEGTIISLLDAQHAEVLWDDLIIKSRRVVIPVQNLLNLTVPYMIMKRANIEKMPIFRTKTFDDKSFRPEVFKKMQDETPEGILTRALSEIKITDLPLNPNAAEFNFESLTGEVQPPSGLEFPMPSFK